MAATIRMLQSADAPAYVALRQAMLAAHPVAFLASPDADLASDLERMQRTLGASEENVIFGAFDPELVGTVGIFRESHAKTAHRATIWGMYVVPAARRLGLGRALVDAALDHGQRHLAGVSQVHLGVSAAAPGARGLYERCGFRAWGVEPGSLRHAGRLYDETHMVLHLPVR